MASYISVVLVPIPNFGVVYAVAVHLLTLYPFHDAACYLGLRDDFF